ncbi:hypothetical protein DY000_02025045 [Brassica cretica]|uniref:WHY domain class transcription factor n=1 Tax=Brassica cretica TaxID=69181 RepID=A0ABQ7EFG8_BRACR|nr:hypothetical protein DY000_02025045 [Brassica cretica]
MSQLLSSPPMAANSKTFLTHRFPEARVLNAAGGFVGKRHGFAVRPTERVKLTVKSRYSDSSSPAYSPQNGKTHLKKSLALIVYVCLFGLGEGSSPRFYVGHSIYKGKAALTIEPRAPEFVALESGAFKLSKEGFLLLQFAPAAGVRQYDWSRKQVFSLSVTEIGVQNKLLNVDESVYIPITKAEFAVLISAFNQFILPHLIGWQAFASSIKPEDSNRLSNASPKYGGDYEWSR